MNNIKIQADKMNNLVDYLRKTHPGGLSEEAITHSCFIRDAISLAVALDRRAEALDKVGSALNKIRCYTKLKQERDRTQVNAAYDTVSNFIYGSWIEEEE